MNKLVIVSYLNFLKLSEKARQICSKYDDFLVSVNKEEYLKLSAEEKKKLQGVALTDETFNTELIEQQKIEPLRKEIAAVERIFSSLPEPKIEVVVEQSYKQKHLKMSRPYAPRKMFYAGYNSKKKGGR
ncbi:MAG: hypothetical protein IJ738_01370 [Alphaproteobacteria bacterium]|nr:hypothetical protein [Alphaproteobacteria bacterium]